MIGKENTGVKTEDEAAPEVIILIMIVDFSAAVRKSFPERKASRKPYS